MRSSSGYFRRLESPGARPSCFTRMNPGCARRAASGRSNTRDIQSRECSTAGSRRGGREADDGCREVRADGFSAQSARGDSRDVSAVCSSRLGRPDMQIFDVRSDAEYFSERVRAKHGGAIPGCVPSGLDGGACCGWNGEIARRVARAVRSARSQDSANEIIPYCQGGYRAAHAYLALKIAGYPKVRNYLGSWAEWGNRDDLPREHPRRK